MQFWKECPCQAFWRGVSWQPLKLLGEGSILSRMVVHRWFTSSPGHVHCWITGTRGYITLQGSLLSRRGIMGLDHDSGSRRKAWISSGAITPRCLLHELQATPPWLFFSIGDIVVISFWAPNFYYFMLIHTWILTHLAHMILVWFVFLALGKGEFWAPEIYIIFHKPSIEYILLLFCSSLTNTLNTFAGDMCNATYWWRADSKGFNPFYFWIPVKLKSTAPTLHILLQTLLWAVSFFIVCS